MCVCVLTVVLVLTLQVEMFGVTADEGSDESGQLLQDLVDIEQELFTALALHFRSAVTVVISGVYRIFLSNVHVFLFWWNPLPYPPPPPPPPPPPLTHPAYPT